MALLGNAPPQLRAFSFPSEELVSGESGTSKSRPLRAHSNEMLASVKGMSWGWGSVTILCHKTCPLACLLHAQPSLQRQRKGFSFVFSFSTVGAVQGLGDPQHPHCVLPGAKAPAFHFPCQDCTLRDCLAGNALAFLPPGATHRPTKYPKTSCLVGLQGGDPVVAWSQPDTLALPYPCSALPSCFFQETFK